jgi:hypothetical protein
MLTHSYSTCTRLCISAVTYMYLRCYMYNIPIALECACGLMLLLISVVFSFVKIRNDFRAQTQQTFVCS